MRKSGPQILRRPGKRERGSERKAKWRKPAITFVLLRRRNSDGEQQPPSEEDRRFLLGRPSKEDRGKKIHVFFAQLKTNFLVTYLSKNKNDDDDFQRQVHCRHQREDDANNIRTMTVTTMTRDDGVASLGQPKSNRTCGQSDTILTSHLVSRREEFLGAGRETKQLWLLFCFFLANRPDRPMQVVLSPTIKKGSDDMGK